MRLSSVLLSLGLGAATSAYPSAPDHDSRVHQFKVDLSAGVPRMLELVKNTILPEQPEYPGLGSSLGIDLDVLKSLRKEWLYNYNWEADQKYMNTFKHFTTTLDGLRIHFIHEKSKQPNAIPLILFHGWPGSFLEFLPVIKNLTEKITLPDGSIVSFDVIVPSLPGYAFSSAPPFNWTLSDTARTMNKLMVDVLGYKTYATHGTDWGCALAYNLYDLFPVNVRASHFVFLPFYPLNAAQLAAENITLSPLEQFEVERFETWAATGGAYFQEMATEPNTIGLALYDNPVGQLSWIGQKFISWSDPRQGTPPSLLTHNEILRSVSLYYLTHSFVSAAFTYAQNTNADGFKTNYTKANTDAPLLYSTFKYNVGFWPPALVSRVGNLVSYKNHEFGGHFPGVDNPPALIEDLREIKKYWK